MAYTATAGTKRWIRAQDLNLKPGDPDNADTPITSLGGGDSVTLAVIDPATNAAVSSAAGTNGGAGDDWYAKVSIPSAPGRYILRAKVVYAGDTEYFYDELLVEEVVGPV